MDRRNFLSGLLGLTGAAALGGLALQSAQAMPVAPLDLNTRDPKPDETPANAQADAGRTPDGTAVEKTQYYYRSRRRRRRRRSRVVCRTYRTRWGRWVRRCRRVYYYW